MIKRLLTLTICSLVVLAAMALAQDPAAAPADPAQPQGGPKTERGIVAKAMSDNKGTSDVRTLEATVPLHRHDGSQILKFNIPDPAMEVIESTVRLLVDGKSLLKQDFAVARVQGTAQYVIRFLKHVPADSLVEVTYSYGTPRQGASAPQLSSGLMGGPGSRLAVPLSGTGSRTLPLAVYFGSQGSQGLTDVPRGKGWSTLATPQGATMPVRHTGRTEHGFSVMNFQLGGATISYGTIKNVSGNDQDSFRSEFIARNIVGGGQTACLRAGDPSAAPPEGSSRDVQLSSFAWGDPAKSPVWFTQSKVRIDPNYQPIDSSQAANDITAMLQDPNKWGGRNLMSAWYGGSEHASEWLQLENPADPRKGRTDLPQFQGFDVSYQGYGARLNNLVTYSRNTFQQEQIVTRRTSEEVDERIDLQSPSGGTQVHLGENTFSTVRPPNADKLNSTEQDLLADPGENTSQTHRVRSLTQRLAAGQGAPVVTVSQDEWNSLNRITGIETPTRQSTSTSVSGVKLFGANLGYSNQRWDYENADLSRWQGGGEQGSDIHNFNFSDLRLLGRLQLGGRFYLSSVDNQGMQYTRSTLSAPGFELFKGMSMSGITYERMRDRDGGSGAHRNIGLNGELLGTTWNASYDSLDMTAQLRNPDSTFANPYGRDIMVESRSLNLAHPVTQWGTDLRAGWVESLQDGQSTGHHYYVAASQPLKAPGGNLVVQGAQWRHYDNFGVLRPSYTWAAIYTAPGMLEAGIRGFEHYGAGDELSFISRSTWVKGTVGKATLGVTWRTNPLMNDAPGRALPYLVRGDMREYTLSMPLTSHVAGSVSFVQNGSMGYSAIEGMDWPNVPLNGPAAAGLRPTTWTWGENWSTRYALTYTAGKGSLALNRNVTRFNASGINLVEWAVQAQYQVSSADQMQFSYHNMKARSPFYATDVASSQVGGAPLGDSYVLAYSRTLPNGSKLGLSVSDLGPLADSAYWQANNPYFSYVQPWASIRPDERLQRFFLTYETPF